jgi:PST family polysaccharide transporter
VYGHLVAVVAQVAVQMYLSGWIPSFGFSTAASRELLRFGAAVQSKRVLEYAALNMDNLVVGRVLGMTALGYYDKAFSTMDRLVTRLTLGQAPFRIFSIIHEDNERFRRGYARLITSVTLLGFPVLAACGVAADSLIVVLYGERWLPSVAPFQLLCAGGMCKLLNAYASQANEAAGNLWPQVQRQAIGMVLVVTGAALGGAYGGVAGAALGVTTAMVVLAVMMQALVRRATGFSWTAMLAPLVPASVGAALLAGVLLGVELMARSLVDDPARWQLLAAQMVVGGGFYAAFVLLSPFAAVRDLVRDSIEDLLPARSLDAFDRLTGLVRRARTL